MPKLTLTNVLILTAIVLVVLKFRTQLLGVVSKIPVVGGLVG